MDNITTVGVAGKAGVLLYATGGREDKPEFGVFRSADGGETWEKVLDGNFSMGRGSMNCARIFTYEDRAYLHSPRGLYKSIDLGRTWRLVPDSPAFEFNVMAGEDDTHLAGISRDGLFESRDRGETWEKIAPAPPVPENQRWMQSHTYYDFTWDYVRDVFYVSGADIAYRYARTDDEKE
jgi:photosystem II stability/assembly factor-like uncharacterized protein